MEEIVCLSRSFLGRDNKSNCEVTVMIQCFVPVQHGGHDYTCDYRVFVDDKVVKQFRMVGVDAAQALLLAISALALDTEVALELRDISYDSKRLADLAAVRAGLMK